MTYTKDDFKELITEKLRRNFGRDISEAKEPGLRHGNSGHYV